MLLIYSLLFFQRLQGNLTQAEYGAIVLFLTVLNWEDMVTAPCDGSP